MRSCSECICERCLYRWSGRCPFGECFDDLRAKMRSYIDAHDGEIRNGWSHWNRPGEQDHWCRGGVFYPVDVCYRFREYEGQNVHFCFGAMVSVFQDGYINCSLVDTIGCTECIKQNGGLENETGNF